MGERHAWIGRVFFGQTWLMYAGSLGPSELHAHHAFQVVMSPAPDMAMRDGEGQSVRCRAAIVPPDVPHGRFEGSPLGIVFYLEADDRSGRQLRRTVGASTRAMDWEKAGQPLEALPLALPETLAEADALRARVLEALIGPEIRPDPVHPAVRHTLAVLPSLLDGRIRLDALAREAGLSSSRLAHLFSEQVGIPLRRFVLWSRMRRAADSFRVGATLTEAAQEAGFSDSAHLSHTFRKMIGMAPSEVLGWVEWVT